VINEKMDSSSLLKSVTAKVGLDKLLGNNLNNELVFAKQGPGRAYLQTSLKYYLPIDLIKAENRGLEVRQQFFAQNDEKMTKPLTEVKVGENLRGKMTVIVPEDRYYVMLEDFLPAGLEGIDFTLKTSEEELNYDEVSDCQDFDCLWKENYFNYSEVRDDRVMYFADYLPAGVYEVNYFVRATTPGVFIDQPALAQETYFPEVFGRSAASRFSVKE
jgi:uncharacterized protein YfaS (alpha-2-macroglobulin family)